MAVSALLAAPTAEAQNVGFVTAQGGQFVLNGAPFRFVGTNAYFLLDAANYGSTAHTTEMLSVATALGFTVLRTWAFMDGTGTTGGFQTSLGVYDETTARQLDWILRQADLAGVRVILALTDYWEAYGGMSWYVRQCVRRGASVDLFYTNACARDYYQRWVRFLVNRPNTYSPQDSEPRTADNPNGYRRYKNDPTIFAWDLANEPRSGDPTGDTVYYWVRDMAAYIKSLGVQQMVYVGEEGFDIAANAGYYSPVATSYNNQTYLFNGALGVSFRRNTADPNIDFASAHLYPEYWNFSFDAGNYWIADHMKIASDLGKPFVLGEFGVSSSAVPAEADRAAIMQKWLDNFDFGSGGAGGALVFELICAQTCSNYGGNLATFYPPAGSVSAVLGAAAALANRTTGPPPPPSGLSLTALSPSGVLAGSAGFTLTVTGAGFDTGATILWNSVARATTVLSASQATTAIEDWEVAQPDPDGVPVSVQNGDGTLSNALVLEIASPSVASCPDGQYRAEYFANTTLSGTPIFTRCEGPIDSNWGVGGPGFGVPTDNFSVRWTGRFLFANKKYTFTAISDDGVRVWLDGQSLINSWVDQPPTTHTANRGVKGGWHTVKVEYYERSEGAVVSVGWQ
jgi:mannan endo-1,4-beta-mannosidase